jgi:hypothetical protein
LPGASSPGRRQASGGAIFEKLWRKLIDWSIEREEDHLRKG